MGSEVIALTRPNLPPLDETQGMNEWHAVFTIQLGELVESGVFDWSKPYLNWHEAAYDDWQYTRICDYFIKRFEYREISIIPPREWFSILQRKLIYELMPIYRELYKSLDNGFNPLANKDRYYKERKIESEYPETLLSSNADYISTGIDVEGQEIEIIDNYADAMERISRIHSIDQMLCDELECMFFGLYTANVNGL